jgi:hypothetical protein
VDGKVEVYSTEGVGTEIKVTFNAQVVQDEEAAISDFELVKLYNSLQRPTVRLVGFDNKHRGIQLLRNVLSNYIIRRWGFLLAQGSDECDIIIVNEDTSPVSCAAEEKTLDKAFIILSSARGDPRLMNAVTEYERLGGFCRIVYKPYGPQRLHAALKLSLHALKIARATQLRSTEDTEQHPPQLSHSQSSSDDIPSLASGLPRRYSEDKKVLTVRPPLGPRSFTAHPLSSWSSTQSPLEQEELNGREVHLDLPVFSQSPSSPTITIGTGGTLLKSSVGTVEPKRAVRVLVVEDNAILRSLLLVRFLTRLWSLRSCLMVCRIRWLQHKVSVVHDDDDNLN